MLLKPKTFIVSIIFFTISNLFSQTTIDQNGIKTTVIGTLRANNTQALRYEIASVAYNSFHWQAGGLIIIELFEESYGTGYEKYIIENGFGQGANSGSPIIKLTESNGVNHSAKIVFGNPIDLATSFGGYVNKQLPILLDIRYYAGYKVKITYLQQKVDVLTSHNQIRINETPTPTDIPDFTVSTELNNDLITSGNLRVSGNGDHFIMNGNVGIGTITPNSLCKLDVNGKAFIRSSLYVNDIRGGDGSDITIGPNIGGNSSTVFMIGGVDASEVMRINYNKNIGIGTTNPAYKLDVIGTIRSREVKVDLLGADFVFENDYQLMPLHELEKYIKENKHLPEIAPAKEMQENGVNLGDLNTQLLQKIEELTLYTIEQEKKINAQANEIETFKDLAIRLSKIEQELVKK